MAKGTKFKFPPFTKLMNPGLRLYPGAFITVPDDILDAIQYITGAVEMSKPLPPGVPLDEDIFDAILWHLHEVHSHQGNELIVSMTINAIEQIQMEALWRQIKRKKEQACSGT